MIHPARSVPFNELEAHLAAEVAAGNVSVVTDGSLALYRYTVECQFERRWTPWNLIARGLIVDTEARRVVATPFPKFFNYGERPEPLPDEPFEVTEKLDGSLGIIFHHRGEWRVATRGSFRSEQAKWATEWLNRNVKTVLLDSSDTYLAEIIYPANRIVISYPFEGLVLLAAYDLRGEEWGRSELRELAAAAGLRMARSPLESAGLDGLLDIARKLSRDEEGFVVRFESGLRIKIKGDEYCRIHRLISRVTPLAVWESMVEGDDLDAVRRDLPEEFHADFDAIVARLGSEWDGFAIGLGAAVERCAVMSDKDLGIMIQADALAVPAAVQPFIFPARKRGFLVEMEKPGSAARRKAFTTFRPTGNVLPGYVPSTAVNRFAEEVAG